MGLIDDVWFGSRPWEMGAAGQNSGIQAGGSRRRMPVLLVGEWLRPGRPDKGPGWKGGKGKGAKCNLSPGGAKGDAKKSAVSDLRRWVGQVGTVRRSASEFQRMHQRWLARACPSATDGCYSTANTVCKGVCFCIQCDFGQREHMLARLVRSIVEVVQRWHAGLLGSGPANGGPLKS